jgi:hypothetical protein
MKKVTITTLILLAFAFYSNAQTEEPTTPPAATPPVVATPPAVVTPPVVATPPAAGTTTPSTASTSSDNYGWNNRISFIVGGGASIIASNLYNDPIVNRTTNAVIIEKASIGKPNVTLGILYTPFVSSITRCIPVLDGQTKTTKKIIEYYPRGISFALFINPVSLTKLSDNAFSNSVDLGLGAGYRTGSFSVLGTVEFFSVRQPRQYFVEQFKDNKQPYIINGEIQTSIDVNDNSIFRSVVAVSFGIKFCYTFDIVKSFYKTSNDLTK